jgi:heptosyltransferase-2|tara:strand:- start:7618 stop:8604 length:987 start_codon:yes stop_codon:yes gene_type:complete
MATPVFQCLKENLPDTRLILCVRPYATGILADNPHVDAVLGCDDKSISGLKEFRCAIGHYNPEAGLLLTNTTHSFITFKVAGIAKIYGYKRNWRKYFLSGGPAPQMLNGKVAPEPMQDYYLKLCEFLGLVLPQNPQPRLFISDKLLRHGNDLLQAYGIGESDLLIGINPGASFGSSKCWPSPYFAKLCDMLHDRYTCKILLLVGPAEEDIARNIVDQSSAKIINTAGDKLDLEELKPVIKRCNILVTNDTGPRHYAAAFDIPNIVLMGPTNPIYTARNTERSVVLRKELACSPCHKKTCPFDHHSCMKELTPELVFGEVAKLLPRDRN